MKTKGNIIALKYYRLSPEARAKILASIETSNEMSVKTFYSIMQRKNPRQSWYLHLSIIAAAFETSIEQLISPDPMPPKKVFKRKSKIKQTEV